MRRWFVLLVLAAVVVSAAPAPAAVPSLVLATQNVRYTLGPRQALHDIRQAARGSDVLALQEMGARRARRYEPPGWATWQALDHRAGQTAVMWRVSRLRLVGAFPMLLHRSNLFPSANRYSAVVVLAVRGTRRCLAVVSVHMVPHIDVRGRLTTLRRGRLAALALRTYASAGRVLVRGCAVALGGDWNLGAYASRRARDPRGMFATMTGAGFRGQWYGRQRLGPTLGRRAVDGFWTRRLVPVSQRVIRGTYSDHNGVRVTVQLGRR